jgi:lipid II isoglutaminyl synthase (glutamine-hydrolysing)
LPGLYNVYNALAAASLGLALGATLDEVVGGLGTFTAAFGRFERIEADGREVVMLLIKNPAGANEVVRTVVDAETPAVVVVALNDAIADGRDVSWIWDVDFEPLLERVEQVVVTGVRAAELGLRFVYGGLAESALNVVEPLDEALTLGLELVPAGGRLVVLPTYTAMLALRAIATERGLVRPYWERA